MAAATLEAFVVWLENELDRNAALHLPPPGWDLHDNVLAPKHIRGPYDAVICVRVLINLANLDQQKQALANMKRAIGFEREVERDER